MNKLLARYLADFNREYWDRDSPGPWSTLMVVIAVLALVLALER